jgi:hypothetical protein
MKNSIKMGGGSPLKPSAGRMAWAGLSGQYSGDVRPGDVHGRSGVDGRNTCFLSYPSLAVHTVMAMLFRHAECVSRRHESWNIRLLLSFFCLFFRCWSMFFGRYPLWQFLLRWSTAPHFQPTCHFVLLYSVLVERSPMGALTLYIRAAAAAFRPRSLSLLAGCRSFSERRPFSSSSNLWRQSFGKWRVLPQCQYIICR